MADADATITDNKILSIRDTPYSGCQNGAGISISYKMGTKYFGHTDTVANNIVLDYQKVGIVADGLNTATVNNNTVTGQNTPGVNGQNGIGILRGAKATVSNNTVSNSAYFIACPTDGTEPNFALCNVSGTKVGPKNSSAAGFCFITSMALSPSAATQSRAMVVEESKVSSSPGIPTDEKGGSQENAHAAAKAGIADRQLV